MDFISILPDIGAILAVLLVAFLFMRAKKDWESDTENRNEDYENFKKTLDNRCKILDLRQKEIEEMKNKFYREVNDALAHIDRKLAILHIDREDRKVYKDRFHDLILRISEIELSLNDQKKEVISLNSRLKIKEGKLPELRNKKQ